jgi:Spondin_N
MLKQRRALLAFGVLGLAGCGGGGGDVAGAAQPEVGNAQVLAADTATYRVTVRNHWTAAAFPTQFPSGAHLTGIVGATHGARVDFWSLGGLASPGIKDMAERGRKTPLLDEVANAIAAGSAEFALSGDGVALGVPEVTLLFNISTKFPRVTLVSMLGPSPDWFTGVGGVSLLGDGQWLQRLELPLRVYDAGTDDGTTFVSANVASNPAVPAQALSTDARDSDLLNGVHRVTGQALASILFERLA